MNKKTLFSPLGLVSITAGLVLSVAMISFMPSSLRIDLTEDRLYSLSDGTRNIVSNLDQQLEVMFFYSDSATEDIPQIRSFATRVQELLREIVMASNSNLRLSVIDPEPFSEDEDLATQFGIQPVPVTQGGEEIYFGLVVTNGSGENMPFNMQVSETIPLIRPDQEEFLEYEVIKLVAKVNNPDLPVVGLITQLDIDGGFDPVRGQATAPWMVMEYIRQLYEVRRVDIAGIDANNHIDDEVDILMVVHPQDLSEEILYQIDQYIMRGGAIMLFLDPNADSMVTQSPQGTLIPAGMRSELPRLLEAWGIAFENDKVLADNELALRVVMGQSRRPSPHLGMLGVQRNYLAQNDIITNGLETINFSSAGAIAQLEETSTIFEPLIESSTDAMLMDAALLENVADPSVLFDEFVSSQQSYVVAARVSGLLDSAFPEGRPIVSEEGEESESQSEITSNSLASEDTVVEQEVVGSEEAEEEIAEAVEEEVIEVREHISGSGTIANIVVFADTDFLSDRMWVQVAQFLGRRIPQPFANNGDLIINALDNLSGSADLVSIRSRGRYSRPFTRVLDLQREADDRLRTEEADLLSRMAETEASLADLNQVEDGEPIGQITPEIQSEIDRFNGEMLETRRRLRDVQYQLTEDIERLGANLKAIDTALIPILLTIILLVMHYLRVQRRKSGN
ncbi:MAG: GldG family protein [Pseudomonadota bacterium]|nr:GldG family protein [Pseudomonadota bacterium]MEC9299419.1 GldG family protein [Pseudomonadota bacterium]